MFKMNGLDQLVRQLGNLEKSAKKLEGTHTVPVVELLTPDFIARCSVKGTFDEILAAEGFSGSSQKNFESIAPALLDAAIAKWTSFGNWRQMLDQAAKEWTLNQVKI